MKQFIFVLSVLLLNITTFCIADDYERNSELLTELYRPNHVSTDRLLSIVSKLDYPAHFSADNQQLIIRAKQSTIDEIQSLLLQLDHPARTFSVHLRNRAENVNGAKVYSTTHRSNQQQIYSMIENSTLTVVKEHQHQQQIRQLTSHWLRVDTTPVKGQYIILNLQSANNDVYITVKRRVWTHQSFQIINQQVSGPIGQWLSINDKDKYNNTNGVQNWATQHNTIEPLFIKIESTN